MKPTYWMTEAVSNSKQYPIGEGPEVVEPNGAHGEQWELVGPASVCAFTDDDGDQMIRYVWTWRKVPT